MRREFETLADHSRKRLGDIARPSLWISKAQDLKKPMIPRMQIEEVVKNSLRLDCLLPCVRSAEEPSSFGPSSKGFEMRADLPNFEDCVGIILNTPDLSSGLKGALRIF